MRKWCLTYFTFKLIKIITFYKILSLFFYFIVNPLFKAINVNDTTISFTFTGRYENIITNLFMLKTNFACRYVSLTFRLMVKFILTVRDFKNSLITADVFQLSCVSQWNTFFVGFHFCYNILNSSKFNNVSWP